MKIIIKILLSVICVVFVCNSSNAQQAKVQPKTSSTPVNSNTNVNSENPGAVKIQPLQAMPAQKPTAPGGGFAVPAETSAPLKIKVQEPADRVETPLPKLPVNTVIYR